MHKLAGRDEVRGKGNWQQYLSSVSDSRGVVLIMVLWVIAILSIVAMELSFAMRTEVNITRNMQGELQLYAMAEGGIQRAIAELVYKHDPRIKAKRKTMQADETPVDLKEWISDGRNYTVLFNQGTCTVRVVGEAGKVNINLVSDPMLRKITTNLGLQGEARDIAVDSILDWRDPDDLHRINGAENDYYRSLPEPYDCKNGNLDSLEELLLVRGVTPELFYGKKGVKKEGEGGKEISFGLKDIFSIYAQGEQVDINSAPVPVLEVFLGIPREVARLVVKAREGKSFENAADIITRVPEMAPLLGEVGRFIIFQAVVPYYTVEARGKSKDGGSTRGIKAIVKIDLKEKKAHKIVQWLDSFVF